MSRRSKKSRAKRSGASASSSKPAGKTGVPFEFKVPAVSALGDDELPRCAIIILNWNGRHHLEGCFSSLQAMHYPQDRFEVILIDNGSTDGSVAEVQQRHPWVRLFENGRNVGFAAGCNQGTREALDADICVFINNDIRVEPEFLRELVAPIVRGACAATSAKMYSWDGKLMNSTGGGMNFHGIGIQVSYLETPGPEHDEARRTLFACGGAMAMDKAVFDELGGFDDEFFAYYEDVDLGWRTWVYGYEIHYTPSAVCYHHHSSTSARVPVERLRLLQIRNPLLACFKNYDDENLQKVLPTMLALATRRAFISAGLADQSAYRIEHLADLAAPGRFARLKERLVSRLTGRAATHDLVNRVAVADLMGINDLLGRWEHWSERREEVQSRRRRPDAEIMPLFLRPLWCIEDDPGYRELHTGMANFQGIEALFHGLTSMDKDPNR